MHVGLCGRAGAGKDTAAAALVAEGRSRVAFADLLRDMAYAIDPLVAVLGPDAPLHLSELVDAVGWDQAKKTGEVRRFLQRLGTDGVRNHLGDDTWVEAAMAKVTGPTVFTDVRFPNEAAAIVAAGGIIVRVVRPGLEAVEPHVSETALDDWPVDAVLLNERSPEKLGADLLAGVRWAAERRDRWCVADYPPGSGTRCTHRPVIGSDLCNRHGGRPPRI